MGQIEFIAPTQRAYRRMYSVLFEPFDIGKWFVLGFSAWLAALSDGGGGGGGNSVDLGDPSGWDGDTSGWMDWFQENTLLAVAIVVGVLLIILFVIALVVALLWVSSRGKFMFLDNLVHDRTLVQQPWKEFKREANSLFIWRLGLLLISVAVAMVFLAALLGAMLSTEGLLFIVILLGVFFLIFLLTLGYVTIQLEHFVVPLMYKERLTVGPAIKRFLPLHHQNLSDFILYFLWLLILWTGAVLIILVVGLATCCVGFLLMIIPYIGTVFLLPVAVFFRYLGPEFLRQYGAELDIFPPVLDPPPSG